MKEGTIHKPFLILLLVLGMVTSFLSAWFQSFYLLAIPILILIGYCCLQYPRLLLYLLMASIPWSVQVKVTGSLSTDLPDEPLMLLTAFAALVTAFAAKGLIRTRPHVLLFIIALQLIWMGVTVALSTDTILSFKYLLAKTWYILAFVAAPVLLFRGKEDLRRAGIILLLSMMAVVLLTMVRHARTEFSFETINESLQPFYINHVNYSALLVCTVPLILAAISFSNKKQKTGWMLVLVLSLAALYFSYSRGAWLALAAGLLAYWLVKRGLIVFSFVFFLLLCLAAVFWLKKDERYLKHAHDYNTTIFHGDFREHLVATYQLKDLSNAERFHRWIAGIRMTGESWRTGFGPNTFYNHYKSYTVPAFKTWVSNNPEHSTVHNYFLLLLIEQGLPGMLLFVTLIAFLFHYAQKIYHRAKDPFWKTTAITVASVFTMICTVNFLSDLIEADEVGSIFFLCISTLILADRNTREDSDAPADIQRIA